MRSAAARGPGPGPMVIVILMAVTVTVTVTAKDGTNQQTLLTIEGKGSSNIFRPSYKRFLSFNNDASNIRVEMVFAVPFLQIPIGGKTLEGPHGSGSGVTPVVDVNAKSLLTASVILFMLFFVIPKFVRVLVPSVHGGRGFDESEISRVMRGVESVFNVNMTACWQQGVCSLIQASHTSSLSQNPSNWAKVVDGISNVKWLESFIAGSYFGEALDSAKKGEDGCKTFHSQCPLSTEKIDRFAKELARRYINHLIYMSNKVIAN